MSVLTPVWPALPVPLPGQDTGAIKTQGYTLSAALANSQLTSAPKKL